MKAIALVRVSTKAQELDSQREKVIQEILKDGFDESDVIIIEDKESGSKLSEEERSGLNKLKHTVESDQVSSVYVYEISRISRKESILYSIREYLQHHHVQLICLVPYFQMFNDDWSISDQAAFTFSIFSTLSSQETRIRTARMMRGKERKKNEGKLSVGRPLFGYTLDNDHRPVPHPQDSIIIQEIFQRYSNLESSGSIGKDLWLRKALHTKSQKMVTYQTYICWLLKDERYAGVKDSIYPAIISKELFNKCKDIMANKPEHFKRKSKTICTYPLQGYIYTEDGYCLTPSITNNRYVKMNGVSKTPISLNMKAADELTRRVLKQYVESGILDIDRQNLYSELSDLYEKNSIKLSNIDYHIQNLIDENERINRRIIKGRLSESVGDKMIDANVLEMHKLEDVRMSLRFTQTELSNRLIILANPMHSESQEIPLLAKEDIKQAVQKYISKIIVKKIGFSNYRLTYKFKDGTEKVGEFLSLKSGVCYKIDNVDVTKPQ